jgi:hypothetical protein
VRNTILLSHSAFVGFSALPTGARFVVGKLVDEQPLPNLAGSDDASLDAQLLFESLLEAVGAGSVAADSSGAHDCDVRSCVDNGLVGEVGGSVMVGASVCEVS